MPSRSSVISNAEYLSKIFLSLHLVSVNLTWINLIGRLSIGLLASKIQVAGAMPRHMAVTGG